MKGRKEGEEEEEGLEGGKQRPGRKKSVDGKYERLLEMCAELKVGTTPLCRKKW